MNDFLSWNVTGAGLAPEWLTQLLARYLSGTLIDLAVWPLVQLAVLLGVVLTVVAYLTLAERKISAWIQVRVGPNRVGPMGLLQPLADGIKLLLKEDIIPAEADKDVFTVAPIISMVAALTVLALLPYGPLWASITNVNIGLLLVLSVSSVGVLGLILGGWASGSKYSMLGALRSAAQMVSYEAAMGLSIIGVLMFTRTLSLQGVVEAQRDLNIWLILFQLPAFVMYLFAAVAETNRAPFDLPEAESELVGGFHTEYSGFRFSIYFIAEYANMVVVSAIAVALFLGGWYLPLGNGLAAWFEKRPDLFALLGVLVFAAKTAFVLYLFFWLRWTFPRYRFDQLMDIGWKWMIPSALLNIVLTAIIFTVGQELNLIRAKGDGLVITPLGYGYFIGMSVLSLIPIALLLQTINQNSRTFNLHAHRTTIRFSERYASPKEDVAPAAETKSESAQADSPTASETKKD